MAEATNKRAEPRTVSRSHSELIRWMSIQDANSAGFVHGGVVMRMCDEAAGIAAIRHSGCRVVTAGMDRMTFLQPVHVGELLRCTRQRQRRLADLDGGRRPGRGGERGHRRGPAHRDGLPDHGRRGRARGADGGPAARGRGPHRGAAPARGRDPQAQPPDRARGDPQGAPGRRRARRADPAHLPPVPLLSFPCSWP